MDGLESARREDCLSIRERRESGGESRREGWKRMSRDVVGRIVKSKGERMYCKQCGLPRGVGNSNIWYYSGVIVSK